ncbi:hypothetical protein [Nostoc sp. TCL26-01]|uniref:hypothetical protein n=1 Tax=Nostoc sp. TCL26-01 TaxID=2576904 RepID=UPI0015B969FC|nr:hypothetical protein [Nostoc sp. TCL26-01]QLE58898.1 hypothetical protein FD725_27400 [Nostoc sp. TCL26-01]
MKSQIFSISSTVVIILGAVISSLSMTSPAKADVWCWPWETGCTADGRPGTSGNDILGNVRDGFIIRVINATDTTIFVDVVAYVDDPGTSACSELKTNKLLIEQHKQSISLDGLLLARCGSRGLNKFGTWTFSPGENALILNGSDKITGRYATFKARSQDGRVWEKKVDMGGTIGNFTFTFR